MQVKPNQKIAQTKITKHTQTLKHAKVKRLQAHQKPQIRTNHPKQSKKPPTKTHKITQKTQKPPQIPLNLKPPILFLKSLQILSL